MRVLHEAAASNADARLAIEMFCYSVRKQIAAMIAALEASTCSYSPAASGKMMRKSAPPICGGLSWIGVQSRCAQFVASQEDEQIARHIWALST